MAKKEEELLRSIEELRTEVRELREVVNMLVDIIMNMDQDEGGEGEFDLPGLDGMDPRGRFSM